MKKSPKPNALDEYQRAASRTAPRDLNAYGIHSAHHFDADLLQKLDQLIWTAGLTGEAGEFADIMKKVHGHGHKLDEEARLKAGKELGDVLWYLSVLAESLGFKLLQIANMNIEKLMKRYPDGFDIKRSMHREK